MVELSRLKVSGTSVRARATNKKASRWGGVYESRLVKMTVSSRPLR